MTAVLLLRCCYIDTIQKITNKTCQMTYGKVKFKNLDVIFVYKTKWLPNLKRISLYSFYS